MPGYTLITISISLHHGHRQLSSYLPLSVAAATTTQIKPAADTTTPSTSTTHPQLPQQPLPLPHTATPENIPKLGQYLLDQFCDMTFHCSTPFPVMSKKPTHMHLKEGAVPHPQHTPVPLPLHWKTQAKAVLDHNFTKGIITPVTIGTPTNWCSQMVITANKDSTTRRTVDLQHLNSQCLQETHHCQSSFQLACQVPPNSYKTVLDAVDGYHAIALDKESQPLTTFITEWRRYMYLRLPQDYLASGDGYT